MTTDLQELSEWLAYSPETGEFTWLKTSGKGYAGRIAGTRHAKGYITISVRGRMMLAHRVAWLFVNGKWPSQQIDHVNGDKADNRIANLREATNAQNHCNRGPQKNNTSGVKGVYWFKPNRQWKAQIQVGGKQITLGYFHEFDAAVRCRKEAERKYQGDWQHKGPPTISYGPDDARRAQAETDLFEAAE